MPLKDDFQEFFNYVYPHVTNPRQINDIKRIFYAGVFVALKSTIEFSELSSDQGVEKLNELLDEVTKYMESQKP